MPSYYTDTLKDLVIGRLQELSGDTRYEDAWILNAASEAQSDLVSTERLVTPRVLLSVDGIANEWSYPTPAVGSGVSSYSEMVGAEWDDDGSIQKEWLPLVKASYGWVRNRNQSPSYYNGEPASHWFANRGSNRPGFAIATTPVTTTALYGIFVATTALITAATLAAEIVLTDRFTDLWLNLICQKLTSVSNRAVSREYADRVTSELARIKPAEITAEQGFYTVSQDMESWEA